ncbi:hypothetical protein UA32_07180 [Photobacterium angustum]|uniref:Glycosyltransferase n=1 Tax=Photobacterium angustum TaxID=661 RepID=A0ABX5GY92_PHOAN|nr:glycosyltransferase [Photobacterium angustum]KJG39026.1 hypothetical protein UA32_07180 [Photobacterium angustum]PSX00732.1 hypothetical protein C0W27_22515 [Photobacterium angustum]
MKILLLITCLGRGGADKQVIELAKSLNRKGNEVLVVSMLTLGVMGTEAKNDINIKSLNIERGKVDLISLFKFYRIVKDFKPVILHSHMKHAVIFSRAFKFIFFSNVKLINSFHNICSDKDRFNYLLRFSDFISDLNTFVSSASKLSYVKRNIVNKYKSIVVGNYIPQVSVKFPFREKSEVNYVIGALGRIHSIKNYELLIKSFYFFNKEIKNSKLVIAGHGKIDDLVRFSDTLGISDRVSFIGPISDISNFFYNIDLYVSTSKTEGFCLSLAEAIQHHRFSVVTNSGGVTDVLEDTSFIVNNHNEHDFSQRMLDAYDLDESRINEIINLNLNKVENNFSLDVIINKWISIYGQLL